MNVPHVGECEDEYSWTPYGLQRYHIIESDKTIEYFSCKDNLTLVGGSYRYCQNNQWSSADPQCLCKYRNNS